MADADEEHWLAIESNPEVMNKFASQMGLDTSKYCFADVWGLDDDLLAMVPQPLVALILLFPSKAKIKADKQEDKKGEDSSIFFLRQVHALDDACGTIAMIHAMTNNAKALEIKPGSLLEKYLDAGQGKTAAERGDALASNTDIHKLHDSFSEQGQTSQASSGKSGHHFVCLTQIGNEVVELDGCKPFVLHHGPVGDSFLKTAARVIKQSYMDPHPDVLDFTLIALAQTQD